MKSVSRSRSMMGLLSIVASTVAMASALTVRSAPLHAQDRVALVGGMLIDGYEAPPIHHAAILIEGDRIVEVGPADEVDIPAGTRIIDTEGMTMLPGLIDLHVHLMILGHGEYTEWFPIFTERMDEMMAISAKQLLMAGVTTAVDLGGPLEIIGIRDRVAAGEEVAIMRRGKVVARLVPPASRRAKRLPSMKSFRESIRASGTPLSRTVLQNRREERF